MRRSSSAEERELHRGSSTRGAQRLFEERLKEQKERHDGGNYWVGTGGTSPFGRGGEHPQGIRVGPAAAARAAR